MAVYSVHVKGADLSGLADAAFLRQGFAWGAFLFGPLWLFRRGLWLAVMVWAALFLILLTMASLDLLSFEASLTLLFLLQLLLGFEANDLLEVNLADKGFHLLEIIAGRTADEAEVAFYRHHEPALQGRDVASKAPPRDMPPPHRDVLGVFPEPGSRR
jgi:hypothetical protein